MKQLYRLSLFLACLLISLGLQAASTVRIFTDADGNRIEVGETFHLTIEAENCTGSINVSQMPKGIKVVYHTSQSQSSHTITNGKSVQRFVTSLIMTCKGETPGKYSFGPVMVDGVKSNVLTYQVVPASGNSSRQKPGNSSAGAGSLAGQLPTGPLFVGKGNEEMFLKAFVNKSTAYEQEAIEYIVKLYTTYGDIKFLGAAAAPKFDGFVVEESSDVSKSFVFEDFNGKSYKTAVIARYIIFPQKSGALKVQGNTYTVSTDAREYYQDPYFQTITVKHPVQLNVTPNDVNIEVKALPQPIPANFMGGVGRFSVRSSFGATSLSTNTAYPLVYTVEGEGNVKYLKLPDLAPLLPNSIEVFSPEVSVDVKVGSSNVSGSSRFDFSIMPREAGNFSIPDLTLSYFDPSEGQYKTITAKGYDIAVAQGSASAKSQQSATFNPELLPAGVPQLKVGIPYVNSWLYWLWYIVPVLFFAGALVAYRKYINDHADMTALRSKKASKMALKRLAKAYQCYKSHQEEAFYDEMLAALWGYIGDKLKMPTSELNRSNVSEEFKSHGVSEAAFMPVINLIDECEYAKYTPVSRDANMHQLYNDALDALSKVDKEYSDKSAAPADASQSNDSDDEIL